MHEGAIGSFGLVKELAIGLHVAVTWLAIVKVGAQAENDLRLS